MQLHLLTLALLAAANSLSAQSNDPIIVRFKPRAATDKPFMTVGSPTTVVPSDSGFINIPADCPRHAIRTFALRNDQAAYDNYLAGKITAQRFTELKDIYGYEPAILSQAPDTSNRIHLFVGLSGKGEKVVIFDLNQDRDFSNDPVHRFDTAYFDKPRNKRPALPELVLQTRTGPQPIQFNPYESYYTASSYKDKVARLLELSLITNMNWVGTLNAGGDTHSLSLIDNINHVYPRPNSTNMNLCFKADSANGYVYTRKENIRLGNALYKWTNITGPADPHPVIAFHKIKTIPAFNAGPGSFLPPVTARDYMTGQPIDFTAYKGKYLIIDFWGTWCGPCMELIPKIREHHAALKGKPVQMISVALDYAKDEAKLKATILRENMPWQHIWQNREDMSNDESITKLFKVQTYPTFFLISPEGEILYRGTAAEGLQETIGLLDAELAVPKKQTAHL